MTWLGPGIYTTALLLNFVSIWLSLGICFAIALYFAHPSRRRVHQVAHHA
jgi:hypothetical protein